MLSAKVYDCGLCGVAPVVVRSTTFPVRFLESMEVVAVADDFTGARVRYWRLKRGMSQRVLADLVGMTQSYISQIESGLKEVDKRSTLVRLAESLQVSVVDLTGQPYAPTDHQHARALTAIPEIRAALISLAYVDLPASPGRTMEEIKAATGELKRWRRNCQYANAAPLIAPLLRDLGSAASGSGAHERSEALRLLVLTAHNAAFVLKYLGYIDLSLSAADRCHLAATALNEPEWIGLAEYTRLHMLPPESLSLGRSLASATADTLQPQIGSPAVRQCYGMLHLTTAWTEALAGRQDRAADHVAEAAEVAESLGPDPADGGFGGMNFGPTNVAQWRASLALEGGEPGKAVELFRAIDSDKIHSPSRLAQFHIDAGCALSASRRHDMEAVVQFVRAETVAPERVRLSHAVRETVGAMLRRARADAGGARLRDLATRVGVA